jgi:phosphate transport system protein
MKHHFEKEFDKIREKIIFMGTAVEQQLFKAIDSLLGNNEKAANEVVQADAEIDKLEISIDNLCVTLFAKFQPIAFDLRFLTAVIKINNDFERIGDQAVSIAKRALYLIPRPGLRTDISSMAKLAREMFHLVIDALVNNNTEFANKVLRLEKAMDNLELDAFHKIVPIMKEDPKNIKRGLHLLLTVRCLERIGDLCTNVAEDIIFYMQARDIRHLGAGDVNHSG